MGIYKLSVLTMVLHTCAHTAPHRSVGLGIHTVMPWACGCEVHISAMIRMLRRKDMIVECTFIEVGKMSIRRHAEQPLGEFEHIVCIAGLRTFAVGNIALTILLGSEMLTTAVASYRERACVSNSVPEET